MRLKDNVVLITGGSRGIGKAIAQKLSELENKIIIVGRNEEALKTASKEIKNCEYIVCDIFRQDQLEKLSMEIQDKYRDLNILINNAGVQYNYYLPSETNPYKKIEDEICINFTAPVKLTSLLLPQLMMQKDAAIVNVTSSLAIAPKANAAVYCSTKSALRGFTKTLRYQLEKSPIKVIELMPPLVDTDMTKGRGNNKISPKVVADELVDGLKRNKQEIYVGKAKLLKTIHRIAPAFIEKKMRSSI